MCGLFGPHFDTIEDDWFAVYLVSTVLSTYHFRKKWLEGKVSFPVKRISSFNACFMKKCAHDSLYQSMYNIFFKQQYTSSNYF